MEGVREERISIPKGTEQHPPVSIAGTSPRNPINPGILSNSFVRKPYATIRTDILNNKERRIEKERIPTEKTTMKFPTGNQSIRESYTPLKLLESTKKTGFIG